MAQNICGCVHFTAKDLKHMCQRRGSLPGMKGQCPFLECEVTKCFYKYPLKLLIPSYATNNCCQWVYPLNFGGGLVEGDDISIIINIGEKCCILWTSQSFPKIYSCEKGKICQQHFNYNLHSGSLLCVLPDPLVCYKNSSYIQTQEVYITQDANVVLLDWFTCGRLARGERWNFSRLQTTTTVFMNNTLILKEAQCLEDTEFLSVKKSMMSYNVLGMCILIGPYLLPLCADILKDLGKSGEYGKSSRKDILFAVSPFYINYDSELHGCVIRFSAESVPLAYRELERLLHSLLGQLGGNPFANK